MNAETHPGFFSEMPNPMSNVSNIQRNCSKILRDPKAREKVFTPRDKVLHLGKAFKLRLSYGILEILRVDPNDIRPFSRIRTFETTLQAQDGIPANVKIESFERDGDPIYTRVSVYGGESSNPFDWSTRIVLIRNTDHGATVRELGIGRSLIDVLRGRPSEPSDRARAKALEEVSRITDLVKSNL